MDRLQLYTLHRAAASFLICVISRIWLIDCAAAAAARDGWRTNWRILKNLHGLKMIWRWYEDGIRWDRAGRGNINIVRTFHVAREFVALVIDESSLIIKNIILLIITITKYLASLKCGQFAMLSNIFSIYFRSGIMKSTNQTNLITVDGKDRQSHKTQLLVCSCRGKGNKLCKVSYPGPGPHPPSWTLLL